MERGERFRAVFDREVQFVARCLRRFGVRESEVEDGVQRVFLVLSDKIADVDPAKERAFLGGTAANVAAHFRRSASRRPLAPGEFLEDVYASPQKSPEDGAHLAEARVILDRILSEMSETLREAFVLFELEGLATPEIAEMLGVPRGTIASRIRLAREVFLTRSREFVGEER